MSAQLLGRLAESPAAPDPAPSLEAVAQAMVRAARGSDCKPRTAWLRRAAALCAWEVFEPLRGDPVRMELCKPVDEGGDRVVRLASPGLKRADGTTIVRARVQVDPAVANMPEEPDEPAAVEEPLAVPEDALRAVAAEMPPGPAAGAAGEVAAGAFAAAASDAAIAAAPAPSFGDVGEERIQPGEAAAAADAAKKMPRIVDDPLASDEALAAEVALTLAAEDVPEDVHHELRDEDIEELPAESAQPDDGAEK